MISNLRMLIAAVITLSLSTTAIGLIAHWMVHWHTGFMWKRNDIRLFNYHPLFMTMGFIFFAPAGTAVYRLSPHGISKFWQKIFHFVIQLIALTFACMGVTAVVQYHNDFGYKNFIDVHSWCGLATFSLFLLQFVAGFVSFLFPRLPDDLRSKVAKWHAISGKTIVLLAILTAVSGVSRFMSGSRNGKLTAEQKVADILVIVLYVLFGVVLYMLTERPNRSNSSIESLE